MSSDFQRVHAVAAAFEEKTYGKLAEKFVKPEDFSAALTAAGIDVKSRVAEDILGEISMHPVKNKDIEAFVKRYQLLQQAVPGSDDFMGGEGRRHYREKFDSALSHSLAVLAESPPLPPTSKGDSSSMSETKPGLDVRIALDTTFNIRQFRHLALVYDTDRDRKISAVNFQRSLLDMGVDVSRAELQEYLHTAIEHGVVNVDEFAERIETVRRERGVAVVESPPRREEASVFSPSVRNLQPWSHKYRAVSQMQVESLRRELGSDVSSSRSADKGGSSSRVVEMKGKPSPLP